MTDCTTTPLLDLLRAVPTDARVIYQHSPTDHSIIPAGRLCHEAAAEIARLTAERDELRAELHREHADSMQNIADCDLVIAAERAHIGAAPVAIIDTRDVLGLCAPAEADFTALYALQGHRVALVDLGLAKETP